MLLKRLYRKLRAISKDYWGAIRNSGSSGFPTTFYRSLRMIRAHIQHKIGPRHYCQYQFDHVDPREWANYVDDSDKFKEIFRKASAPHLRKLVRNKRLFFEHCLACNLPTIPIIAIVTRHSATNVTSIPVVNNIRDWKSAVENVPASLFLKPVDRTHGLGCFSASFHDGAWHFLNTKGELDDLIVHLIGESERIKQDYIVQPRMFCHRDLTPIIPDGALGTMRLVTYMDGSKPRIFLAAMKIPIGKNDTDNFHGGCTGNLVAAIDARSGTLSMARGSARLEWPEIISVAQHPGSGALIEGFKLPLWDEVVSLGLRAQASLPLLKTVGWDIAVTDRGVMIVEGNTAYDLSIFQVTHQCGLRDALHKEIFFSDTNPKETLNKSFHS